MGEVTSHSRHIGGGCVVYKRIPDFQICLYQHVINVYILIEYEELDGIRYSSGFICLNLFLEEYIECVYHTHRI